VVDGRSLKTHPFDPDAPAISGTVPLMIGSCETEMTFSYSQAPENFSYNEEQALSRIKGFVGVDDAQARQLMAVYRASQPKASPSDLWVMISTDHQYRRNGIRASERKAAQGKALSWHYLFTWKTPVLDGLLKSPHTICIPFSFGNVDIASGLTGTGSDRYALQERMMDAWYAFMKSGNPNHKGLPQWKPYDAGDRPTMIFDNECRLVNDPAREERIAIGACPPYRADGSRLT
jgi:para-nitrobenzyl esterase